MTAGAGGWGRVVRAHLQESLINLEIRMLSFLCKLEYHVEKITAGMPQAGEQSGEEHQTQPEPGSNPDCITSWLCYVERVSCPL